MGIGVNLKVPGLLFATMNLFSLGIYWCPLRESNSQPLTYEVTALPTELRGPTVFSDVEQTCPDRYGS